MKGKTYTNKGKLNFNGLVTCVDSIVEVCRCKYTCMIKRDIKDPMIYTCYMFVYH